MSFLLHVVGPLERWDTIAWRYYGAAGAYRPIVEANRALFTDPLSALPELPPAGTELKIPIVAAASRPTSDDLPPWLR
ncbi:MAG: hypothetical protein DI527_16450 [Chelatococcus sp.]|nr:MAG: hypothetical protein DI527_16450 [Chelatococcus sp.]